MSPTAQTDVLVIGGGPAGASTASRLAAAGHAVTLVERRATPTIVARGDVLVPAACRELVDLGIDLGSVGGHVLDGARLWHGGRSIALRWPDDDEGWAVSRSALDTALLDHARDAGVNVLTGAEATDPIVERGFVRGATIVPNEAIGVADPADHLAEVTDVRCRFLVVADGARSRFGRGLGTTRDRRWPYALSAACYFESDRGGDTWVDTVLGLAGPDDTPVAGHGWVNPVGDGRVDVGVTVLSSYRNVRGVNVVKLFDEFAHSTAERWRFDPAARLTDPARMRIPLGGSIGPKMGPTFLVVGDAAGMANPFNSHGVTGALLTGRIAADVLDEALSVGNSTTLQQYPALLDDALAQYHKVGRLTARFLGRPWLLRTALRSGIRSEAAMGAALRIATNELRDGETGGAERAYRLATVLTRFAPSW